MRSGLLNAAVLCCAILTEASAQGLPRSREILPPEISHDRFRDIPKVDPRHYSVEFENEEVRVLRGRLESEAAVPLHDHRSGVFVAITEVHIRLAWPAGHIRDIHLGPGEARWIYNDSHTEKNLVNKAAEFLFIETKTKPASPK